MELYLKTDTQINVYKMDNYDKNGYSGETEGEVPTSVRHKIFKYKVKGIEQ